MAGQHEVRIRLISEPALWCWEVVEQKTGVVVESSWQSRWEGYDTREEAIAAARRTLTPPARIGAPVVRRRSVA